MPDYVVPLAISSKPELGLLGSYYLSVFNILSTERNNGMGEGFIPVMKIVDYGLYSGDDDVEMLVDIILLCDNRYLSFKHEESEKKKK